MEVRGRYHTQQLLPGNSSSGQHMPTAANHTITHAMANMSDVNTFFMEGREARSSAALHVHRTAHALRLTTLGFSLIYCLGEAINCGYG